jgi:dUTP pyrophosphatase
MSIEPFYLKMKIIVPGGKPFTMGRLEDAGYDIFSAESMTIYPFSKVLVETGIATEFPIGFVGLILDRSSMGIKGITRLAGVVDSGYRNTWKISLFNLSEVAIPIESTIDNPNAKAIAQVVFTRYYKATPTIVTELENSARGEDGFGSSDSNH